MGQTNLSSDLPSEKVYQFIVDFKRKHDGLSPSAVLIMHRLELPDKKVRAVLSALESAERIKRTPEGIVLHGARWLPPDHNARAEVSLVTVEFSSNTYQEPDDPVKPSSLVLPDTYTPPATLEAAQNAARHFWTAGRLHMGRIEELTRENKALRRQLPQRNTPTAAKQIVNLEIENERLQADLQYARAQWRKFEREAGATKELFAYGKWAARKIAALTGEAQHDPAAALVQ